MTDASETCLACGAGNPEPVLPYPLSEPRDALVFANRRIARCQRCGLHQITPVPSAAELTTYYREAYRSGERGRAADADRYPYDSPWFLSRGRAVRGFLESSGAWPPDGGAGAVLDIGAGFGHVLFALGEGLPEARLFATEPDPVCAPFLEHVGARVLTASPEGFPAERPDRPFDVIVMTHVLEHLVEPVRALAELSPLLAPGGRLVLEVPHCSPRFAEQWETAPHLSFFEEGSLTACVERAGGRVDRIVVCGPMYERRTWRDWIPPAVRRFLRSHVVPRRESGGPAADWKDPAVLPDPRFAEVGPDRLWLRAIVAFD